jgi:asparagine synthase (glutamine-hydrolysing)
MLGAIRQGQSVADMCGVAAIFAYGPEPTPVATEQLVRIRDHMSRRGPDGAGLWLSPDRRVGLGHRRLSIIDLSDAGAQPMSDRHGRLVISFNGEIYNYRALRRELELKGVQFRSESDTEVLLYLYAERGAEMVHALRGMYAFALWDSHRNGLLLARDPFGIKPLYYADDGRCLRAASQVKALLAGGDIDTAAEPAGHVGFFLWGHVPEPFTLYKGIRALPAGSTLWVDEDGAQEPRSFASVPALLAEAEQRPAKLDRDEAHQAIRLALLDSVRHHQVADVDVGVFLSAGLDSTTLAALAMETGGRLRTVTLGFDEYRGTAQDEVPLAEEVANRLGTDHTTIRVTSAGFREELERILAAMDQPTLDGINTYFVARAARASGLKVALSGLGGDELFAGYPSFRQIPALVRALRPIPGAATLGRGFRIVAGPVLRQFGSPKYAGLLEYGADFGSAFLLRRGLFMPWELPELLDPDLVREGWRALSPLSHLGATVHDLESDRFRVTALELCWYMRNQLLRDTDWAGMAHSIEVRVPLVDWTLVRTLAPILAAHPALGKDALAGAARPRLPASVLDRPKTGFTVPVRDWMLNGRAPRLRERGLRGWTRYVHGAYTGAAA